MNVVMNLIQMAVEIGRTWYAANEENRAKIEAETHEKLAELAAMNSKYTSEHDERTLATRAEIEAARKDPTEP